MHRLRRIAAGPLVAATLLALAVFAQPGPEQPTPTPEQTPPPKGETTLLPAAELFNGVTTARTKGGQTKEVRVVLRTWVVDNFQKVERFPQEGFRVANLRAGNLKTTIGGEQLQRLEGEFWAVPASTFMSVESGGDTVVLQTLDVQDSAGAKQPGGQEQPPKEQPAP